ncbi:MAG: wax ester/triacylglycerol synthase family O-acyltransferase [Gammaproteobacteria bacterium]|nr:MAG: wax ester/triacylglycerol synthase family O-acyltransferase [Gammaproteobacteria bacterium]
MTEQAWEPVNGADAVWLRLESADNPMVITALAVTEPLSVADLHRLVQSRFMQFERFGWIPVNHSGIWFWEPDPEFEPEFHVRHLALPDPGDDEALATLVGDLMSQPLAENHPLWQFALIEGYQGRSVIVMRVHHCYADGLSLAALFGAISDDAPNVRPIPVRKEPVSESERARTYQGILETLRRALERVTHIKGEWTEKAGQLLAMADAGQAPSQVLAAVLGEVAQLMALPDDSPSPLTGQRLSPLKRCAWSAPVALTELKQTARVLGSSVNDLLLGAVSGGLGRYATLQGGEAPGKLTAAMPVNLRPLNHADGRQALLGLGNYFGLALVPLAVSAANPLESLYRVRHESEKLRQSWQPAIVHVAMSLLGLVPGLRQTALELINRRASLVLSNVPGPWRPRYLMGRKVEDVMFWVPQAGQICTGVSLISYGGQLRMGLVTDRNHIARPDALMGCMSSALEDYIQLAREGWHPPRPASGSRRSGQS